MATRAKRRKKTQAAIKADRLKREKVLEMEKRRDQLSWSQVEQQYLNCMHTLSSGNSALDIIGVLKDKALSAEDESRLKVLTRVLGDDQLRYGADLDTIHAEHVKKSAALKNDTDIMAAFVVFERYTAWTESFTQNVIHGTIDELHNIAAKY